MHMNIGVEALLMRKQYALTGRHCMPHTCNMKAPHKSRHIICGPMPPATISPLCTHPGSTLTLLLLLLTLALLLLLLTCTKQNCQPSLRLPLEQRY